MTLFARKRDQEWIKAGGRKIKDRMGSRWRGVANDRNGDKDRECGKSRSGQVSVSTWDRIHHPRLLSINSLSLSLQSFIVNSIVSIHSLLQNT